MSPKLAVGRFLAFFAKNRNFDKKFRPEIEDFRENEKSRILPHGLTYTNPKNQLEIA